MNGEENVVKILEEKGRIGLVELASLFLPSPPTRVWEEEFDGEECEDCDWEDEEEWERTKSKCIIKDAQYVDG